MKKKKILDDFDPTDEAPPEKEALRVLQRRWDVLGAIPSNGRVATKQDIADRLYKRHSMGHDIQVSRQSFLRYVQRDIEILSRAINGLNKQEIVANRQGVSWGESGSPFKTSGLSIGETLAFGMLKKLGVAWMPSSMRDALDPYFESAMEDAAIRVGEKSPMPPRQAELQAKKWLDKIVSLPDWIQFQRKEIKKNVEKVIHEALLQEQSLEIVYQGKPKRILFPQALVQRGARTYLLATAPNKPDISPFLLNRIDSASPSIERFKAASKADLKAQLDRGIAQPKFSSQDANGQSIVYGQPIYLRFNADAGTANLLAETPIGKDQTIVATNLTPQKAWSEIPPNPCLKEDPESIWATISVTVLLQEELIWWLRSMGPFIQVIEPHFIRDRIQYDLKRALLNYS